MTWIKICGITNLEDALTAVHAGAHALGFVFYAKSPRRIDPEGARRIGADLPDQVEKVGVFVDEPAEQVREIVERAELTAVQLYDTKCALAVNDYSKANQSGLRGKIIFVVPGDRLVDGGLFNSADFQKTLFALLVDSSSAAHPGGTGHRFDWVGTQEMIRSLNGTCRTIVAGGLSPSNVGEVLGLLRPWGVDVASGVEFKPGKKDPDKVRAFVAAVRAAEKSA